MISQIIFRILFLTTLVLSLYLFSVLYCVPSVPLADLFCSICLVLVLRSHRLFVPSQYKFAAAKENDIFA